MLWKFLARQNTGFFLSTRKFIASKLLLSRACSSFDHTLKPDMAAGGTEYHDFPKEEEKILELWDKLEAFQSCLRQSKDRPRFELLYLFPFYGCEFAWKLHFLLNFIR